MFSFNDIRPYHKGCLLAHNFGKNRGGIFKVIQAFKALDFKGSKFNLS